MMVKRAMVLWVSWSVDLTSRANVPLAISTDMYALGGGIQNRSHGNADGYEGEGRQWEYRVGCQWSGPHALIQHIGLPI